MRIEDQWTAPPVSSFHDFATRTVPAIVQARASASEPRKPHLRNPLSKPGNCKRLKPRNGTRANTLASTKSKARSEGERPSACSVYNIYNDGQYVCPGAGGGAEEYFGGSDLGVPSLSL